MRKIVVTLLCLICFTSSFAQVSGRYSIKATLLDSVGKKLSDANVMIMHPKDSSLITYGRSNSTGLVEFKNLKRQDVLFKVFAVGYLPYQDLVKPGEAAEINLGELPMKVLQKELMEVVIKAARAPLSIRGDTVEYNASSFKVPPGSTVEELLRRLPGMQVETDGTIKAQGETVQRVTVDGKRFFGDDPKMATKNLPAEAISKVQVFNGKSEQSKITGVDDGERQKTLNLELKASHKKGGFGKATVGVGTDRRLEGRLNYNKFNDKHQFAIVGFGNNTNQTGMSWDDYQDFKGSQSFNWGDDGNFGFYGGGVGIIIGGGGDDESLTIQAGGGSRDKGFSKNWAGGLNYNFDNKKTKFNTSYYYNQTNQTLDATSTRENILANSSYIANGNSGNLNFNGNHRGALRYEQKLDSLNSLVVLTNFRVGNGNARNQSITEFFRGGASPTNRSAINNFNRFNTFGMSNTAIFRHQFRKKGRNFAASVGYNINNTDGEADQRSTNTFFDIRPGEDSTFNLSQFNDTKSLRNEIKSSLLYIEPLNNKFYWETFYNFSLNASEVDRDVFDIKTNEASVRNLNLSRFYTSDILYNRVGTTVRYSFKGLNVALGLGAQQLGLKGEFSGDQGAALTGTVNQKYFDWVPNLTLFYSLKNNRRLSFRYSKSVNAPQIGQLQPIVDNSNPLYIVEGNPELQPQKTHNLSGYFSYFNPANFMNFFANVGYNQNANQIVYSQIVDERLVTRSKPINVEGGNNANLYLSFGFPVVKTKWTMGFGGSGGLAKNPNYINNVENLARSNNYSLNARMDITPNEVISFYPSANWNVGNTKYSINTAQNQKTYTGTYSAEMNVKFPYQTYFNGRFNYRTFQNNRLGFDQNQAIMNLSVYKIMLKNKRGEVRVTAYDVFNQNKGINVSASGTVSSQEQVQTLGRYFMLSFTYNMRGVTGVVRRTGW